MACAIYYLLFTSIFLNDLSQDYLVLTLGAIITAVVTLPSDCKGDKLCLEAKSILDKDAKFFLEGKITGSGMVLKASYKGNINIRGSLELTDVSFVVSVGKETEAYFEVTLKMKDVKFTGDYYHINL